MSVDRRVAQSSLQTGYGRDRGRGSTQWTWSYEPFGATRTEQKANGNQPDVFMRFTGESLDPTGLYQLRAREYDPASGRFLSMDPLPGPPGDPYVSAYAYAADRPTVFVDPTGLFSWKDVRDASVGVAKGIPDALRSVEEAAEIAEQRAGIPEHIKQIPRVGQSALRLLPVTVVVITGADVYGNVRAGDSIPTAIERSLFRTGGAIIGAGRAASVCAALIESGPGVVVCAGAAGVAGAYGGERAGDALATRILGRPREWHAPFHSRFFRARAFWPWSRKAWLGIKSGDAVGTLWLLAAAGVISAPGRGGDLAVVLMIGTTAILVSLFLFGAPRFLMPQALRGTFRGVLRRMNPAEEEPAAL